MTLSDISIRNPVFAWMLMAALVLFGGIAFMRLGISEYPDVDYPFVTVHVTYEGAAPEVMETDIVDVIEDAVMTVEGIRHVSSSARQETAAITIEFELDRDIDVAVQEVQTKVMQVQRRLPPDIDPPLITKTNPEDQPILWVSLSGERGARELMEYARDHLKDKLQSVAGVSEIFFGGYVEPNLRVWLDAKKLAAHELTVQDVLEAISEEHAEIPAGRIETDVKETNLRFMGESLTPQEFENITIKRRGGEAVFTPIRLGEVASVEKGLEDLRRLSRSQGKPALGLGIKKQRGANAVRIAHDIRARLDEIQKSLPADLKVGVNFDSTKFIKDAAAELNFNLVLSALLTAVVCYLFLGSLSSTLNILFAIPTSIVGSFLILYFCGYTLNTFTLLGLILSVGIVVDDAIMVLENIERHRALGKSVVQAALEGAREITFAAFAASLAIVAIFIPVVFMAGFIGKLFMQFGVTMSVAVMISYLEALTLTPMRASQFRQRAGSGPTHLRAYTPPHLSRMNRLMGQAADSTPPPPPNNLSYGLAWMERFMTHLTEVYRHLLTWCLAHRWVVVAGALVAFGLSFLPARDLKREFVPAQDQGMFMIRAKTPLGSSLNFTDQRLRQAEDVIMKHPAVQRYFSATGGFGGGEVNTGVIFVTLKDRNQRAENPKTGKPVSQAEVMEGLASAIKLPDTELFFQDLSTRGFSARRGFPVEFTVRGPDWDTLTEVSAKLAAAMSQNNPHFAMVDTNYETGMPELKIIPNRAQAQAFGVGMRDIGTAIGALMGGVRAGKFTEAGRRNDIRVRLIPEQRQSGSDITRIFVRNFRGELVPLSAVVTVKEHTALQGITREDRERAIGVYANVGKDRSQAEALAEVRRLAGEILPLGYRVVMGGTAQMFEESFASLAGVLILGIIVAYMILASQFNSFIHPITVLLALPFSLTGALLGLSLAGLSLNVFSFIGIILLMGIVKKNSILLVDFTNQRRAQGFGVHDALMTACPQRLRPIVMTSVSTLAAAIPPALAIGPGSETRIAMAVVVIGGVIVSTLLTLFVVPCVYSLFAAVRKG